MVSFQLSAFRGLLGLEVGTAAKVSILDFHRCACDGSVGWVAVVTRVVALL